MASLARADVNVSLGLLQAVKSEETPAFAPMSVVDMMGLLYYGSAGQTEKQLSGLFAGESRDAVAKEAAKAVRTSPGYARVGSVWFDERVQVTADFFKAADTQWGFHVSSAPLAGDPAKAAGLINFHYDQKTNGFFKNVVSADDFSTSPDMVAVIVTAFKLPWQGDVFSKGRTTVLKFYRSSSDNFFVQMMRSRQHFSYYEDDRFQALSIPYKGGDFSLMLFLPRDATKFDEAVSRLSGKYFDEVRGKMKSELVNLTLPKVDFKTELNWREIFMKSKIADAFTPLKANFSNINNNEPEPLYIARFKEEVEITWNERGTEAKSVMVASTDPFGPAPAKPPEPQAVVFNANHPFVFVIYDKKANDAAFAGIIDKASQMEVVER